MDLSPTVSTLFIWLLLLPAVRTQSNSSARYLDKLLQGYAYKAFANPRTGVPYDGAVPNNLSGISISAMRLRSGSLRRRGVSRYKEFEIPIGVLERPYVERLVLVHQNLGNWSALYYPPPAGYMYVTPVLGLLAYDAFNLSSIDLQELDIVASQRPIVIHFDNVGHSAAKCVFYGLQGGFNMSNSSEGNQCYMIYQGHFSMVIVTPGASPAPSPLPSDRGENKSKVWIIVGSVLGTVLVLLLLACLVWLLMKYRHKRMQYMEAASEVEDPLEMAMIGSRRTHAAKATRTQQMFESGYAP